MTTAVMGYVFAPLSGFFRGVNHWFLCAAHARAAAELSRQGYHEEAKNIMMDYAKLKETE